MYQLKKEQYQEVITQLGDSFCPVFVHSVLEETIRGTVYTDDTRFPASFLIGTESGVYYAGGNERQSDFHRSLKSFYHAVSERNARFTLFSANEKWDAVITDTLPELTQMSRYSFMSYGDASSIGEFQLPEGFS